MRRLAPLQAVELALVTVLTGVHRYTIHGMSSLRLRTNFGLDRTGEKIFPEEELVHLDGHKGSKPVR